VNPKIGDYCRCEQCGAHGPVGKIRHVVGGAAGAFFIGGERTVICYGCWATLTSPNPRPFYDVTVLERAA